MHTRIISLVFTQGSLTLQPPCEILLRISKRVRIILLNIKAVTFPNLRTKQVLKCTWADENGPENCESRGSEVQTKNRLFSFSMF